MAHELIKPNLHIILVHFPVALVVIGALIELFSFLWRRSTFRQAGRWMLLIGAFLCIPTATTGLYALADVARMNNLQANGNWSAVIQGSPLTNDAWQLLTRHLILEAAATAIIVFAVFIWLASGNTWRNRLHWPLLLLVLVGIGAMGYGAWHAGEAIYREAAGVEYNSIAKVSDSIIPLEPTTQQSALAMLAQIERAMPPVQTHMLLAGFAIAAALASFALSLRAAHSVSYYPVSLDRPESMPQATVVPRFGEGNYFSAPPPAEVEHTPVGRFWLLTLVLVILTIAGGWWTLGSATGAWQQARPLQHLWQQVIDGSLNPGQILNRRSLHLMTAGVILICPIVFLCASRWARGNRMLIWSFGILLLLAVAAQLGTGALLLLDGPAGPLTELVPPPIEQ